MSARIDELARILRVPSFLLEDLEASMEQAGYPRVLEEVDKELQELRGLALQGLSMEEPKAEDVRSFLREKARGHEQELYSLVGVSPESFDFERVAAAARSMASAQDGFFLKKGFAEEILRKRPPVQMLEYFGYAGAQELLEKQDVGEAFSALRFTETNEWMHETFQVAYQHFTRKDFELRPIEVRVLGPQWKEIAERFVEKKHHNVSHLKEFGVIFLNPIAQTEPGKFLRDFALLLHYFHEVAFYGRLFDRYSAQPGFAARFTSLLRGDVLESAEMESGQWLIIQRYLWKENPDDDRLFLPRVNPEALHWRKAQQDIVGFGQREPGSGLEFWDELWKVAGFYENEAGEEELAAFHLEDNAMSLASESAGTPQHFSYHQREALWNEIASRYLGGYEALEEAVVSHLHEGVMQLGKPPS